MTHEQPPGFSWHDEQAKAISKALHRADQMCRCNPDFILKNPSEAKLNPEHKINHHVTKSMQERIRLDMAKRQHFYDTPTQDRPTRKNRN